MSASRTSVRDSIKARRSARQLNLLGELEVAALYEHIEQSSTHWPFKKDNTIVLVALNVAIHGAIVAACEVCDALRGEGWG